MRNSSRKESINSSKADSAKSVANNMVEDGPNDGQASQSDASMENHETSDNSFVWSPSMCRRGVFALRQLWDFPEFDPNS